MDNSLLAVRDINHKYIVVGKYLQSSNLRMRDILNEIYPDLFQNNIIIKLTI